MQLRLSYSEIQKFIYQKTNKQLPISYGGTHTIRINYEVNVLFKTSTVGIDVTIERIVGTDVILSYSGGAAIEMMLRTALDRVKNQPGGDALESMPGNMLVLHLGKNPQTAQIFERIELQDVHFDEQYVMIDFAPKS